MSHSTVDSRSAEKDSQLHQRTKAYDFWDEVANCETKLNVGEAANITTHTGNVCENYLSVEFETDTKSRRGIGQVKSHQSLTVEDLNNISVKARLSTTDRISTANLTLEDQISNFNTGASTGFKQLASSEYSFAVDRYHALSVPDAIQSLISAIRDVPLITRSISSRSSSSVYNSSKSLVSSVSTHQMKITETILRFGGVVLSLITFSVMAATSQSQTGSGSTFRMKFADYQAYSYVVALNVVSFVYSCWQLIFIAQSNDFGTFPSYNRALVIFACDQVLAFLLFSASTAAATAAQLSHHGLRNIWPPACSTWDLSLFCSKADAAVVLSFFSSFFVISSSVLSGYNLSKHMLDQ